MRRARAVLLAALLSVPAWAVLPAISPLAQAQDETPRNLLRNGDFERGGATDGSSNRPNNWRSQSSPVAITGVSAEHASDDSHNGTRSACLERSTGMDGETYWYQELDAVPGLALPWGAWATGSVGAGASVLLRLRTFDASRMELGTVETATVTGQFDWQELRGSFAAPSEATRVRFECVLHGDGEAWFDDAYLGLPTDMDNAPFIVSVPPLEAAVGHEYTYRPRAVDLDGPGPAGLTLGLDAAPAGMELVGGVVRWTPAAVPDGAVRVVVNATDGAGHSGFQDFFLQVLPEERERPVYVELVSAGDDPFNLDLSEERFASLMPAIGSLWEDYPGLGVSVSMLFNGAEADALAEAGGSAAEVLATIAAAVDEGWAEVGYSSLEEPTHRNATLDTLDWSDATWEEVVEATTELLSQRIDPSTGQPVAGTDTGGLLAVRDHVGTVSAVVHGHGDAASTHALDRWAACATLLRTELRAVQGSAPSILEGSEVIASMLAEDPDAPFAVYWDGDALRVATNDVWDDMDLYLTALARNGPERLAETLQALAPGRSYVVPVLAMDTGIYLNTSKTVDTYAYHSPYQWAYTHPSSPSLPPELVRTPSERAAAIMATDATLRWLASEYLPQRGGAFVSDSSLRSLLDDGAGGPVSSAELASAAFDLLERRSSLDYPTWAGVEWGYCRGDVRWYSLAELYGLLLRALAAFEDGGGLPGVVEPMTVLGPMEDRPWAFPYQSIPIEDVVTEAARQANALGDDAWRVTPRNVVPSTSSPGGSEANAMEFLLLMAESFLVLLEGGQARSLVNLMPTEQWPLTLSAMGALREVRFPSASWQVRPASASGSLDSTPPVVRRVEPAPGARGVRLDANLTVTFSERMDEATPLQGAVVLEPWTGGEMRWVAHRLVLDPWLPLAGNTTYVARLATSLTDVAGNPLAPSFVWNFTTVGTANKDPVLDPTPNATLVSVLENQTLRLSVEVEDDGPPPLSYRWVLDGITLPGEVGPSIVHVPSYLDEGLHRITVVVQDAGDPPGTATHTWTVNVVNVNLPPRPVSAEPPEGTLEVDERDGGALGFRVVAEDPDEGILGYAWAIDGAPAPTSALSEGGTVLTFTWGFESAGDHTVGLGVQDRMAQGFSLGWTVRVRDVNRPPVVLSQDPQWTVTVEAGARVQLTVNATDPDGDALAYAWLVAGTEAASTAVGRWELATSAVGSLSVDVTVTDARGASTGASFLVNVVPPADRPSPEGAPVWPWLLVLGAVAVLTAFIVWGEHRRRLLGS